MDVVITAALLQDLINILKESAADPVIYSIILFIYTILATVLLPLPVEVGLLLSPATPFFVLALVLGSGKAVGSVIVYLLGLRIGEPVRRWSAKYRLINAIVLAMEWVVRKFHYLGLYVLLSIPLMSDTIPVYLFSLFNEKGTFQLRYFALVNFLAGVTRSVILFALLTIFHISLFS